VIYTHIFLVILVTVVLIIFAEYQNLRNISWILFIGCLTYILLTIEPEEAKLISTNNEFANVDSDSIVNNTTQTSDSNTFINHVPLDSINTNISIYDEVDSPDELQTINIKTLAIATDIVNKEPIGISRLFLSDIDKLFCYTVVNNNLKNSKIIHIWKYNGKEYFNNTIAIGNSPNWRCWSRITIKPEMSGDWQVIVTDTIGTQLESIEFSIIPINGKLIKG